MFEILKNRYWYVPNHGGAIGRLEPKVTELRMSLAGQINGNFAVNDNPMVMEGERVCHSIAASKQ